METLKEAQYRDFLELLDDRQGSGATLITSQFPTKLWHDTIGNPTVADAILDRLVHNAHRIDAQGRDHAQTPRSDRHEPAQTPCRLRGRLQ